jgi:hypothetical protein
LRSSRVHSIFAFAAALAAIPTARPAQAAIADFDKTRAPPPANLRALPDFSRFHGYSTTCSAVSYME